MKIAIHPFLRRWTPVLSILTIAAAPVPGCSQSSAAEADGTPRITQDAEPIAAAPRRAILAAADTIANSRRNAIVIAAERVSPAVVSVNVVRQERLVPRSLWEEMMLPPGAQREVAGLGSGFIIDSSGVVLTNEHVVHGATEVDVTLPDGRQFDASIVGVDEVTDIAVLQIEFAGDLENPLPVAPLGDSEGLMIGE